MVKILPTALLVRELDSFGDASRKFRLHLFESLLLVVDESSHSEIRFDSVGPEEEGSREELQFSHI